MTERKRGVTMKETVAYRTCEMKDREEDKETGENFEEDKQNQVCAGTTYFCFKRPEKKNLQ